MAHTENMLVGGVLTPVTVFDSAAQDIDDAISRIVNGEFDAAVEAGEAAQSALAGIQEAIANIPEGDTPIVNDLSTGGATSALSAEQGVVLKELLNSIDWFGSGTSIPTYSDLDDYTTPGKYFISSGSGAATLTNCPVANDNFVMFVFRRTTGNSINQMIITLNSALYIRGSNSSGTLRTWQQKANLSEVESLIAAITAEDVGAVPVTTRQMSVDANTLTTEGRYFLIAADNAPAHGFLEVKYYEGSLFEPVSGWGATGCIHQRLESYDGEIYERYGLYKADSTAAWEWSQWKADHPIGSYTGNGSDVSRTIDTGGIGYCVIVWNEYGSAIVTGNGAIICEAASGSVSFIGYSQAHVADGVLTLSTTNSVLNASGATTSYQGL